MTLPTVGRNALSLISVKRISQSHAQRPISQGNSGFCQVDKTNHDIFHFSHFPHFPLTVRTVGQSMRPCNHRGTQRHSMNWKAVCPDPAHLPPRLQSSRRQGLLQFLMSELLSQLLALLSAGQGMDSAYNHACSFAHTGTAPGRCLGTGHA